MFLWLLFLTVVPGCTTSTTSVSATPTPFSSTGCFLVSAQTPTVRSGLLRGVSAISPTDAWAVGGYRSPSGSAVLIEHWDGSQWSLVAPPAVGNSTLYGVDALASDDVWAVGGAHGDSLVEHWDGTGWSVAPSPRLQAADYLASVSVDAPDDAWAVGEHWIGGISGGGHYSSLIEHWDGVQWTVSNSPDVVADQPLTSSANGGVSLDSVRTYSAEVGDNLLLSVDAHSPSDVWAVGFYFITGNDRPLALHWDGQAWTAVNPPGTGSLASVLALPGGPVRAFGSSDVRVGRSVPPFLAEWGGSSWRKTTLPMPDSATVASSTATSASDVWAVGQTRAVNPGPLVENWDGHSWDSIGSGSPGTSLYGVAASDGLIVAVGGTTHSPEQPVVLQGC